MPIGSVRGGSGLAIVALPLYEELLESGVGDRGVVARISPNTMRSRSGRSEERPGRTQCLFSRVKLPLLPHEMRLWTGKGSTVSCGHAWCWRLVVGHFRSRFAVLEARWNPVLG